MKTLIFSVVEFIAEKEMAQLPCDPDGVCMRCKEKPPSSQTLTCRTCATPWHLSCLTEPPVSDSDTHWECPDCSDLSNPVPVAPSDGIVLAVRDIQLDTSLSERQKAKKCQEVLAGSSDLSKDKNAPDIFDGSFNCSICMQLPDRPVTTPCGHNFCLRCFEKCINQGRHNCANCRTPIPAKMYTQPRINSQLAMAIRLAKAARSGQSSGPPKVHHFVRNQDRPDTAFTTDRAKKTGKANACSGKIFVTVPPDHFGPIPAENDPKRNRGVLVGDTWEDRMECRQWGAHLPHVAGIAGQSSYGAQSVALSGGYVDDEDHGEWFLYTGSGGRDLSGNKRTNKTQSFDQKFENMNEALRQSCRMGYPVRVVRSHKEKRSAYAPEAGVRYDGVYRIEKCWRKDGIQGCKVCRYLFVRCDNEPAPWTSDESGDRPRPLPEIEELIGAIDITERKDDPSWDYDEEKECWLWKKPPPESRKSVDSGDCSKVRVKRKSNIATEREKLLKGFRCGICRKVMQLPITTPCGHNFCKACLEGAFAGQSLMRERSREGGRSLRAQKNVKKCPSCSNDIADFLENPQVNREMLTLIESWGKKPEEENPEESNENDENDDNDESLDDAAEVSKPSDSADNVLEEIKDNDLNQQHKRRKE
ncbi:hypothetical protein V8G54_037405 [Vigna mungo]|uniref:RING-type E3 ubiquitin transferase n=1 Tax=Vigna mungo TaxID=3915 RepID=A0AAQ3MIK6_VIGMU